MNAHSVPLTAVLVGAWIANKILVVKSVETLLHHIASTRHAQTQAAFLSQVYLFFSFSVDFKLHQHQSLNIIVWT
jgi:hypothetical protein